MILCKQGELEQDFISISNFQYYHRINTLKCREVFTEVLLIDFNKINILIVASTKIAIHSIDKTEKEPQVLIMPVFFYRKTSFRKLFSLDGNYND